MKEKEILLQLKDVSVHYGGVKALDGVDVSLDEGEIVALMGPNGAGKSTVLKAIFGLAEIQSGKVLWHANSAKGKPRLSGGQASQGEIHPVPHQMVARGVAFVPQGRRVFANLSVEENLEIGGFVVDDKQELKRRVEEVMEIFPALKQKRKANAGTLSGGQQQMLAIARGLMSDPKVLLLDEPSLGLAPKIVKEVFAKIKEINERHKTAIMVVEHNIKSLLAISHRAYVLDKGKVVAENTPEEILNSNILERVFMGKSK